MIIMIISSSIFIIVVIFIIIIISFCANNCSNTNMWTVEFILSLYSRISLNQIKSNDWFIVPFAVGRLNCGIPYKL